MNIYGAFGRLVASRTEITLFLAVLVVAGWLLWWQNNRIDAGAAATIVGAFFGGAVLLLANWINRLNERTRAALEATERLGRLKTLVTAELVNVAFGLIGANQTSTLRGCK